LQIFRPEVTDQRNFRSNYFDTLVVVLRVAPTPSERWGWGVEELYGDPTVGPQPKVWTRGQNGRSGAEDGAPERLGCGTVKEEVSQILQRVPAGAA